MAIVVVEGDTSIPVLKIAADTSPEYRRRGIAMIEGAYLQFPNMKFRY
jgi:hypothetical protein